MTEDNDDDFHNKTPERPNIVTQREQERENKKERTGKREQERRQKSLAHLSTEANKELSRVYLVA